MAEVLTVPDRRPSLVKSGSALAVGKCRQGGRERSPLREYEPDVGREVGARADGAVLQIRHEISQGGSRQPRLQTSVTELVHRSYLPEDAKFVRVFEKGH